MDESKQQLVEETQRKIYIMSKYRRWFACGYRGLLSREQYHDGGSCNKCIEIPWKDNDFTEKEYHYKYLKPFSSCMAWILNLHVRFNQWKNNEYE